MAFNKITVLFNEVKSSSGDNKDLLTEIGARDDAEIIAKALKTYGYKTSVYKIDEVSVKSLRNKNSDLFFNLCDGIGSLPHTESKIPELLDEWNFPYTGSDAKSMLLTTDKVSTKKVFLKLGINTPDFLVYAKTPTEPTVNTLGYPVIVKPVSQDCSMGITSDSVVNNFNHLQRQVDKIIHSYKEEALVEKYIDGREFNLTIIGNGQDLKVLPIAEIIFGPTYQSGRKPKIVDFEAKWVDGSVNDLETTSSQPIDLLLLKNLHLDTLAKKVFLACGCRDYARIDMRLGKDNVPYFLEVNVNPDLYPGMGVSKTAGRAGYSHEEFINQLTQIAAKRYGLIS